MSLLAGIYDMSSEIYHADPCEQPSLSRSGIVTLDRATPAKFAALHPRLTQWPETLNRPSTKAQSLGTVVHSILLGVGEEFIARDCDEFMTKKGTPARVWSGEGLAWKEEQEAAGRIVISRDEYRDALNVSEEIDREIAINFGSDWRSLAQFERTLLWQREVQTVPGDDGEPVEIWCRAKPDILLPDAILDAKLTGLPVDDASVSKAIESRGGDIQGVWYPQGLRALCGLGDLPKMDVAVECKDCDGVGWENGRPSMTCATCDGEGKLTVSKSPDYMPFFFIFAEFEPPYTVRVIEMKPEWIARAEYRIERACDTFARCLYANEWPKYTEKMPRRATLDAPPWKMSEWLDAELADVDASLEVSE